MMNENVSFMKDFRPLDDKEKDAIGKVVSIYNNSNLIPCTGCSYCTERCPQDIPVPKIIDCLNSYIESGDWDTKYSYSIAVNGKGKASDCICCGACEKACPQHIEIRDVLRKASHQFEE